VDHILSRWLHDANGSFVGVVAASIDPELIGSFYKTIDVGAWHRCATKSRRRHSRVRRHQHSCNGPAVMQPALREALAVSPIGYYRVDGAVDGINRLVSYRRCRMCITSHSTR